MDAIDHRLLPAPGPPHRQRRVQRRARWTRWCATSSSGARPSSPTCRQSSAPGISTAASRRARCCGSSTTRTPTAPRCRQLARDPRLVGQVESLLGPGVSVYFSQIFFKPPEGGGPKPAHQDNFYFGPTDIEGVVTAWIALDDATLENGCLYFGDGTNLGPVYPHFAPEGEPFNLQLPATVLDKQPMTPAPVRKGGVSFHHGNTFHQSGPNHSAALAPRLRPALRAQRRRVRDPRPALRQRTQAPDHLRPHAFLETTTMETT